MKVTETVQDTVKRYKPRMINWLQPFGRDIDDITQEVYIKVLEAEEGSNLHLIIYGTCSDYRRRELNRRRLEEQNPDSIISNSTPTLSDRTTGGPEEFIDSERLLLARWEKLSPLLKQVARRTFFGYAESIDRIARELKMTSNHVRVARFRVKQIMNGAKTNA